MVAGGVGVDWPLWVRCSLSDVRRWCLAVLWLGCGCDVVAVAGVPGMDPPARLLSLDVGLWPLVGGDKRARLGCRGCHRRGSLPGVSVEISTVAAALTVCQRSPWVWFGVGRFGKKNFKKNVLQALQRCKTL